MKRTLAILALALTLTAHAKPPVDPSVAYVALAIGSQHGWEITACPPGLTTYAHCSLARGDRVLLELQLDITLRDLNGTWTSPWVPSSDGQAFGRLARIGVHGELLIVVIPEANYRVFVSVTRLQ